MNTPDLHSLLQALQNNGVNFILVGGHAVRLHGFNRATEDVDLVVPFDTENGARLIRSLQFLESAKELQAWWFSKEANEEEIQNIRVADELVIDILFTANGETYESLQPFLRKIEIDGVTIPTLDIDGLLKTKTSHREKDAIDRLFLLKIKNS
jgi:predicted nucleotidyltransferase